MVSEEAVTNKLRKKLQQLDNLVATFTKMRQKDNYL